MSTMSTETDAEKAKRDTALRKAYQSANTKLREAHREEFNTLYAAEAQALGYEWKPKQSAEEKAAEEMRRLVEAYPELLAKFSSATPETERTQPGDTP